MHPSDQNEPDDAGDACPPTGCLPAGGVAAVLVAAGRGTRLSQSLPKALVPLAGMPIVARAVQRVLEAAVCERLVVTHTPGMCREFEEALSDYPDVTLVEGGETRQRSVFLALSALRRSDPQIEYVLVHDAARCLASVKLLRRCLAGARLHRAVTAAVPVVDSLVRMSGEGDPPQCRSISRAGVYAVQTPQVFSTDLLWKAHESALAAGFECTDDAGLVERLAPVYVVEGERENLKVTTEGDLIVAEALLQRMESGVAQ